MASPWATLTVLLKIIGPNKYPVLSIYYPRTHFGIFQFFWKMFDKEKTNDKIESIHDIAIKLVEKELLQMESSAKEHTIFILGSKGVGKSTILNKFFDREENPPRPTLALEYSYARRSSSTQQAQRQVLNVWELGSLENAGQLIEVPMRTHGLAHFAAIIMLDLSHPQRVWSELELAYSSLRETAAKMLASVSAAEQQIYRERAAERVKREHNDLATLELMPFPVIIVGGKYDLFMDFDPELKKHICRCLRSLAHLIGASLLFYSSKIPKLFKTLRDTISHLGFGSPANPFRAHTTDYNDALAIWNGTDSWEKIGLAEAGSTVEHIGATLAVAVPQLQLAKTPHNDEAVENPAKDAGFQESVIDEMRAQKDEELQTIVRELRIRGQFENVAV